jgi:hypothetical protein
VEAPRSRSLFSSCAPSSQQATDLFHPLLRLRFGFRLHSAAYVPASTRSSARRAQREREREHQESASRAHEEGDRRRSVFFIFAHDQQGRRRVISLSRRPTCCGPILLSLYRSHVFFRSQFFEHTGERSIPLLIIADPGWDGLKPWGLASCPWMLPSGHVVIC